MGGNYPNGGYRNVAAMELSMPSQATPPIVTASPVSGSGNNVPYVNKYPRLSDMLGNGDSSRGKQIEIDLRTFGDNNAGKLSPGMRDRINRGRSGTGKQVVTIDLKGRNYRVNGKGQIMRAALKLARTVIGVGKRLPKNLWKELLLEILGQILGNFERDLNWAYPESLMILKHNQIKVWSMDPRYAMWQAGALVVPGGTQLSQASTSTPHTPGLGEFCVASVSALPTRTTGNQATWAANGYAPFSNMKDEVMSNLISLQNSSTLTVLRNIVVGFDIPGVFNSKHVATLELAGRITAMPLPTFRYATAQATNPMAFQIGKFNTGGNGGKTKTTFPQKAPDKKVGMTAAQQAILGVAWTATELGDFIDSIYTALPRHRQYGRSYLDKMQRIYEYFPEIDWARALGNVIYNHFEDKVVGTVLGKAQRQLRKTSINGITYQYGATMGGGSMPYIEITF